MAPSNEARGLARPAGVMNTSAAKRNSAFSTQNRKTLILPTKASGTASRAKRSAQRNTSQPTVIQPTTKESFEIKACSEGSEKVFDTTVASNITTA